ncbi:MAG: GNAT family N-acetyltransferase [Beijerinckiaceae bacterium]
MATGMAQSLRIGPQNAALLRAETHDVAALGAGVLFAEAVRPDQLPLIHDVAKSLAARTLEPNAFYEPAFLMHALHHFKGRVSIVLVWANAQRTQLLGLFPLAMPRFDVAAPVLRGWITPYMTNGAPLMDADMAPSVFARFMQWVEDEAGAAAAVIFPSLSLNGPVAAIMRTHAVRAGVLTQTFGSRTRAVMSRAKSVDEFLDQNISAKKAKELRRQRNRLNDQGHLTIRTVNDRVSVRDAFEHFMAIEARSWKGRGGSAMMQNPSAAAFARAMVRAMASEGLCRIDLMELNGQPIAASIQLRSGDRSYFWKTAFDESFAKFSPGLQLAIELSVMNLRDDRIALSDSCAEEGHPMIDELWAERVMVGDVMIGADAQRDGAARFARGRETLKRGLRAKAKQMYRRLRGR